MNDAIYTFNPVEFSRCDWTALAVKSPEFNLMQSWSYGQAKSIVEPWNVVRGVILMGNIEIGIAQVLVRLGPFGVGGLAWLNRGPLTFVNNQDYNENYKNSLVAIKAHFSDKNGYYLRIAPSIFEEDFNFFSQKGTGLEPTLTLGWASARLDLLKSEKKLRSTLHGKWRNSLCRAESYNIKVVKGIDSMLFKIFLEGYREHLKSSGKYSGLSEKFLCVYNDIQMDTEKVEILLAFIEGRLVGGVCIAKYGNFAEYLLGYNNEIGRKNNAGQLLLWNAICSLKKENFQTFDLGGMDPNRTPSGILRFKKRVGAEPYRLARELESKASKFTQRLIRWRVLWARRGF